MSEPAVRVPLVRTGVTIALLFGLLAALLLALGPRDYSDLHTILNTSMCLLSGVLALLFRDLGAQTDRPFPRYLAICFAVTSLLELVHMFSTIEWLIPGSSITEAGAVLRPPTWPLAAHILPIGIGGALWLDRRRDGHRFVFTLVMIAVAAALFPLFVSLPRYSPVWLGITRPSLIAVPLLWLGVGLACWASRRIDRIVPIIAAMAGLQLIGHVLMLYSSAPNDGPAMIAHLGKVAGYLLVLAAMMLMASRDTRERIRAEQRLAEANAELERRVSQRTGELERINTLLEEENLSRKAAEDLLRQNQELLQNITENATSVIYVKDLEGRYLLVNRRFSELFHLDPSAIRGRTDHEIFARDAADAFRAMDQRVISAGVTLTEEETAPHDDGPHVYLSVKSPLRDADGRMRGIFGISTDITERKVAERALRASEEHYRLIFEESPLPKWIYDLETLQFLAVNRAAREHYGFSETEFLAMTLRDIRPPEDLAALDVDVALARQGRSGFGEWRHRRKDGTLLQVVVNAHDIELAGRRARLAVIQDITERKQTELKVQAQLARLDLLHRVTRAIGERQDLQSIYQVAIRSLEDNLAIDLCCICSYDAVDHTLIVTRVGLRSAPLAMELALTQDAHVPIDENGLSRCVRGHLVYEHDISEVAFPFPERLARGGLRSLVVAPLLVESQVFGVMIAARRTPNSFSSGECEFLKQLSEHVALAANQAQLYAALQKAYDDLRQTQQTILQQERLRALGEMASGVAHDINNAISPAALYIESLLEKESTLSASSRDQLETVQHALEDVAQTVARMREFYRQREPQFTLEPVNSNAVVEQVLDLTRARWHDMPQQRGIVIQLQTDLWPDPPAILGLESDIREALTNLVFNAVDAMPNGGRLLLRTRVEVSSAPNKKDAARRALRMEVSDTGIGMDDETRRRCLEPFFTTKGERGTGLGLPMVYGMVQRHGADIQIESAVGRGTTVSVIFPVPAVTPAANEARAELPAPRKRLRLLVVDDDPLLIKSLRDTLEADGHLVVTATDGRAGINAFHGAHVTDQPFAAVITDLGMPYVDGRKVAAEIKAASPATPVILLTGWGQRLAAEGEVPPHVDRLLSKPPKLRDLRAALAELTGTNDA